MKAFVISLAMNIAFLTTVCGREKPFSYINLGFGMLKMEQQWIRSNSYGLYQDFKLTNRLCMTFGVLLDHYHLNAGYDVDTNAIIRKNPNSATEKYIYNYRYCCTSIHFSIYCKYWLKNSRKMHCYLFGGTTTNLVATEDKWYKYYYRSDHNNSPVLKKNENGSSGTQYSDDRIMNVYRPVIGFGLLWKITGKHYLHINGNVSHTIKLNTLYRTATLYPRISLGVAF